MTYPIPAHPCHRMHTSVPCRPPYVHICYICPISCQSSKPRSLQPSASHLRLTPHHAVTALTVPTQPYPSPNIPSSRIPTVTTLVVPPNHTPAENPVTASSLRLGRLNQSPPCHPNVASPIPNPKSTLTVTPPASQGSRPAPWCHSRCSCTTSQCQDPRHASPSIATPPYAATYCLASPCHIISYLTMHHHHASSCRIMPRHVSPCFIKPRHTSSCLIMPYHAPACLAMPQPYPHMPHPNPLSVMSCSLTRLLSTMHNPHRCRSAVSLTCTAPCRRTKQTKATPLAPMPHQSSLHYLITPVITHRA